MCDAPMEGALEEFDKNSSPAENFGQVSFEFTATGDEDPATIARRLLENASDPRSAAYERVLVRPKVNFFLVVLFVIIPPVLAVGGILTAHAMGVYSPWTWVIGAFLMLAWTVLNLGRYIIGAVRLYQRFAPEKVRKKCRFEPSCSEYMILSVKKYGAISGLFRGIDRLKRCRPGNGGTDMP